MTLITCRDISFAYEGVTVVSDLSFDIGPGDYVFILGENGVGKSTLIKGLLKLIKPRSGSIELHGLRGRDIGYLPQQTVAQKDFPAGVFEVVLSGFLARCGTRPFYSGKEKSMALEMLEHLGILELKNRCYRELSGGQQRRVLLARALCAGGSLLILDEPVSGLDPVATRGLYKLLGKLNDSGATVMMASHDSYSAARYASHVIHLGSGSPFFGTVSEFAHTVEGRYYFGNAPGEVAENDDRGTDCDRDDRGTDYDRDDRGIDCDRDDRGTDYDREDRGTDYDRDHDIGESNAGPAGYMHSDNGYYNIGENRLV